jgi:hypothetical protein
MWYDLLDYLDAFAYSAYFNFANFADFSDFVNFAVNHTHGGVLHAGGLIGRFFLFITRGISFFAFLASLVAVTRF